MIINDLRQQQLHLLKLLITFDKFCRKEHISYWLAYGSCLGAVRHGGFIPWDDDVDIEMLKEDYVKLKNAIKRAEGLPFVLQNRETDPEFVSTIYKIRDLNSKIEEVTSFDKHYKYKGLYIDIFIRRPANNGFINKFAQLLQVHFLDKLAKINNSRLRHCLISINCLIIHRVIFSVLDFVNGMNGTQKLGGMPGNWCFEIHDKSTIFPLTSMGFEGHRFPVPGNYKEYLKTTYGDNYMTPLPPDERHMHFSKIEIFDNPE